MLPAPIEPHQLGSDGEAAAGRYLAANGFQILGRNYQTGLGEIDLIALDGQVLVFVEVKTRTDADRSPPEEALTAAKRRKLTQLALAFLKQHGEWDRPCRFDLVAVHWPAGAAQPLVRHYPNAFPAADAYRAF